MEYDIAPEWLDLRGLTRDFVQQELLPFERQVEETDELLPQLMSELRQKAIDIGLYAYNMPVAVGGPALPYIAQVVVREELAKVSVALADIVSRPPRVLLHAQGEQRDRYLLPSVRGEKRWAFALTEPNCGSDVTALQMTAERSNGGFTLNGTKQFISHGSSADFIIVFARATEQGASLGPSAFFVDSGTPGFRVGRIERKMGWRGYPIAELVFNDCYIPSANLIGEIGDGLRLALGQINEARLGVAAHCVGMSQRALELAIEHARSRVQFGQPIAAFQGIQWMIAEMATDVEACRGLVYAAAKTMDAGRDARLPVSMAKFAASEMAGRVADRALQVYGGSGYMEGSVVDMIYRDARAFRIGEGTSEIQKNQIARLIVGKEFVR